MSHSSSLTPMYPPATTSSEDKSGEYVLLFKLSLENVGNTLFFPYELVSEYFPPPPGGRLKVDLVDNEDNMWETFVVYSAVESAFVFRKGWGDYATHYGLLDGDVIHLYKPELCLHDLHFVVDHMSHEEAYDVTDEQKNRAHFLLEVKLTEREISSTCLIIPEDVAISHFPGLNISEPADMILHFVDVEDRDWEIKCQFDALKDGYIIRDGWEDFVAANNVIPTMELIFSVPVHGQDVVNKFMVWVDNGGEGNGGGAGRYRGECRSEVGSGEEGDGEGSGQGSC